MHTGTVKWLNAEKGFSFITPDDGTDDLFARASGNAGMDLSTLEEGQQVHSIITEGNRGAEAEIIP